jgi:hypothetical protein
MAAYKHIENPTPAILCPPSPFLGAVLPYTSRFGLSLRDFRKLLFLLL